MDRTSGLTLNCFLKKLKSQYNFNHLQFKYLELLFFSENLLDLPQEYFFYFNILILIYKNK